MLGIIACHFNPAGYRAPVRNWFLWRDQFPDHIPLRTVELAFGDRFETDANLRRRGGPRNILWQKEALLNLALQHLPADVDKVAWIDADILCDHPDWLLLTGQLLDQYPLVQMFREVTLTDAGLRPVSTCPGSVAARSRDFATTRPGYAWACRRDILDRCGFYPFLVMGAGNSSLLSAACGDWQAPLLRNYHDTLRQHWLPWGQQFYREIQGQAGYVDVAVTHLYHGSPANRRYLSRRRILIDHQFDPHRDVSLQDGILEWTAAASQDMIDRVRDYFLQRKEDE